MNSIKNDKEVYVLEIFFPFAHFKIPYTIKTRKTYFIPRKRAIISIFNAFFDNPISFWKFGKKKRKSKKQHNEDTILNNFLVGAELLEFYKTSEQQRIVQIKARRLTYHPLRDLYDEQQRIVQIKGRGVIRTISNTEFLINAKYRLYLIPLSDNIELKDCPVNYLPFGGQNDYLAFDWKLYKEEAEIVNLKEVVLNNYQLIPRDKVIGFENILLENLFEDFVIVKGTLKLKEELTFAKIKEESSHKFIHLF
ncbi:MAG: CRISPR-associated protein Cas5 [Candidatus Aenigmatarchaeota archaeon]